MYLIIIIILREPSQEGVARPSAAQPGVRNKTLLVDHQTSQGIERSTGAAQAHSVGVAAASTTAGTLKTLPLNRWQKSEGVLMYNVMSKCRLQKIFNSP